MNKFIDLMGHRYGRLVVIERADNDKNGNIRYLCQCDCGNKKIIYRSSLKSGETTSCGCYRKEKTIARLTTHGLTHTRLYSVWQDMRHGCLTPTWHSYKYYGGRGITVCDEWKNDFKAFYDWAIESGYKEEIMSSGYNYWTLERIDNDGNFEPNNCCWADRFAQANNKQDNCVIKNGDEILTLAQTARKQKVSPKTLRARALKYGFDVEKALSNPIEKRNRELLEYKGERLSARALAKKYNMDKNVLLYRLKKGATVAEAIETDINPKKYKYKGTEYTVAQIQKIFDIPITTFRRRIKNGMTIQEAIETPIQSKFSHKKENA